VAPAQAVNVGSRTCLHAREEEVVILRATNEIKAGTYRDFFERFRRLIHGIYLLLVGER
jgi:hypothetical protein